MLRACRQLLRPSGRLAFHTIHPGPDLEYEDYRRAVRAGPRAVSTRRRHYDEMLVAAGFSRVEMVDLTGEFRRTAHEMFVRREQAADRLRAVVGNTSFDDRQAELKRILGALERGFLKRSLLLAKRRD